MPAGARLLIGIPTMGSIHTLLVGRIAQWSRQYPAVTFYFSYIVAPVDRARNQIVRKFLDLRAALGNEGPTHLLMIDSDTIPPPDAIERLFSHGKEIVSGLTPIASFNAGKRMWETYDNCFSNVERDEKGEAKTHIVGRHTGLQEIYRCGAACILIDGKVFDRLEPPYFQFITNEEDTLHVKSEDIYFCDAAHEAGFRIYADSDVVCEHYKSVML